MTIPIDTRPTTVLRSVARFCLACFVTMLWLAPPVDALPVVKDGKPAADIHVNLQGAVGTNGEVLQDAGQWLADALERATGAAPKLVESPGDRPTIIIARADQYPAQADAAGLDLQHTDAFCLAADGDRLYVLGTTEFAARHGVADLLEDWGFRYYNPMPRWHHIPEMTNVEIEDGWTHTEKPAMRGRKIWYAYGVKTPHLGENYKRWAIANRLVQAAPFSTGHSYGNIVGRNPEAFEQHPEYFALLEDGKRDTERGVAARKFCVSNPGLIELVIADRIKLLEENRAKNPYEFMVSVDPSDGQGTCHCDNCVAIGTTTDRVISLANHVAKALREKYPDAWVGLYAYSSHRLPPTIDVEPNVYVQVAMGFNRTEFSLPQLVGKWGEKVSAIGLREYYGVMAWDWGLPGRARGTQVDYHRKWLPYFIKRKVNAMNAETNANWGAQTRGHYVASRMIWDPTVDALELEQQFITDMYGEAAEPIRRMYQRFDQAPQLKPFALKPIFDDLQEAYGLATNENVRGRIIDMMSYLHYVRMMMDFQDAEARDRAHGDEYYNALSPLMTYAYRTRDRGIVHYYALARRLTNGLPLKDKRFEFWYALTEKNRIPERFMQGSGVDPASVPDRAVWMHGEQLTDDEVQALFAEDLAMFAEQGDVIEEFSGDLVPVTIAGDQSGASQIFLNDQPGMARFRYGPSFKIMVGGPRSLTLRVAPNTRKNEITLAGPDGEVIYDDVIYGNVEKPDTDTAEFQDITLDLPVAGTYELAIGGNFRMELPQSVPMVFEASASVPAHLEYSGYQYFYVPKDTQVLRFDVDTRLSLMDPDGKRTDYSAADRVDGKSHIEIPVAKEHRGKVWNTFTQSRGKFYFLNIPPYLSFYRDTMFVPADVAEADRLKPRKIE